MKSKELFNAIGDSQDSYILDAKNPPTKHTAVWIKWVAMAACICLVAIGVIPLLGKQDTPKTNASPFVLTVYALGADNTLSATPMEEGQIVPISTFVAGNGMDGFVFSHKNRDSEKSPLVSIKSTNFSPYIMSDSYTSTTAEEITEIKRIDMEKTQQYIFVVPSKGESAPYSLTISMYDEETSEAAELTIVIEQNENGYTAKIDKINNYEVIGDIDELLKPYQEVLDHLDAEYGYKFYIPEDRKYSVYEAYKDLTPEEFEEQILGELNGSTEGFEGSGGSNFESMSPQKVDFYKVNRTGVTEITGTSQMSDPVAKVVLTGDDVATFLKQIDELCLQPTGTNDNTKGWAYYFVVKYDDGSTTSITLSEGKIEIDGKIYNTTLYQSNAFSTYFD